MQSVFLRSIVVLFVVIAAGGVAGAAQATSGQALLTGPNNAGTTDTSLSAQSTNYGWLVQQTGTGFGIKATTGSTGNTALYGSTANKASYGLNAVNTTAGGTGLHASGPGLAGRFDGNVLVNGNCAGCASRQGFTRTRIDNTADVGQYSSIAIGADGLPLISYFDATNEDLKVAHCNNQACTGATITRLDSAGQVGWYTSITIGSDGLGLISYQDYNSGSPTLKVAHCSNIACTAATKTTIAGTTNDHWGYWTSIVIGEDGMGLIAHENLGSTGGLEVTHCSNVACTSATTPFTPLRPSSGAHGFDFISMSVEGDGRPVISYHDATNGWLIIAHCDDPQCFSANFLPVEPPADSGDDWGTSSSVTTGEDGFPDFAFIDTGSKPGLYIGHCADPDCVSNTQNPPGNPAVNVGSAAAMTVGPNGIPVAAFYDANAGYLRFVACTDPGCSQYNESIDLDTAVGTSGNALSIGPPSMTIGSDGFPIISYYNVTNSALEVLHCSNPFCVPYFRQR